MSNRKLDQATLRAQFIAWLMTKDATEYYCWYDPHNCACAQFAADIGQTDDWENNRRLVDPWLELDRLAAIQPRNFGHLLLRLRQF